MAHWWKQWQHLWWIVVYAWWQYTEKSESSQGNMNFHGKQELTSGSLTFDGYCDLMANRLQSTMNSLQHLQFLGSTFPWLGQSLDMIDWHFSPWPHSLDVPSVCNPQKALKAWTWTCATFLKLALITLGSWLTPPKEWTSKQMLSLTDVSFNSLLLI